jgi:hypothetical protein
LALKFIFNPSSPILSLIFFFLTQRSHWNFRLSQISSLSTIGWSWHEASWICAPRAYLRNRTKTAPFPAATHITRDMVDVAPGHDANVLLNPLFLLYLLSVMHPHTGSTWTWAVEDARRVHQLLPSGTRGFLPCNTPNTGLWYTAKMVHILVLRM